jgi:hypothetical protein
MKIEMLESIKQYGAGEVYDFPDDAARRWIAAGWAREVTKKKEPAKE